jgi:hypothetical protein
MGSPFIIIIDLDGTIVGDVTYQITSYNIISILKKNKHKVNNANSLPECYQNKKKLIRPYFIEFIKTVRRQISNCYIFVYTASDTEWAKKEISWIEKYNSDVSINRPLFTRTSCININGQYYKSISKILPKIQKVVNSHIDTNKILIIDDNSVYIDFQKNLLLCPRYKHVLFNDIWNLIPKKALSDEKIGRVLLKYINSNYLNPVCSKVCDSKTELKYKSHIWFLKKYKDCILCNQEQKNDKFWLYLSKFIQKHKSYSIDAEFIVDKFCQKYKTF